MELVEFTLLDQKFLLGEATLCGVFEVELFELLHACEALTNGVEVGEEATEPTLVDVRLTNAGCLLEDCFLSLLLGSNEENGSTVCNGFLDELVCVVDVLQRLLQVDDVDTGTLSKNETLYFRVPTAGLVTKVNAAVEQLADCDDGHGHLLFLACFVHSTTHTACGFVAGNRLVPALVPDAIPAILIAQTRPKGFVIRVGHAKSPHKWSA